MCKACGNTVLCATLSWAIIAFIITIIIIILLSSKDGTSIFWQIFALNFIIGLIQAWFLIDLIKMLIAFRTEWKLSHPPPPGPQRQEEEEKKKNFGINVVNIVVMYFFGGYVV